MLKIFILCCASISLACPSQGQRDGCAQSPAPCPQEAVIETSRDAADRTKDNDTYPQQLEMENNVRTILIDEMQRIAKANNWSAYELTEMGMKSAPYIFIGWKDWEATPFNKRPPDHYDISFIVITSRDALNSWKNWLLNDVQSQGEKIGQQYLRSQNDPLLKEYSDSFNYYNNMLGRLIETNYPAYMKALQNEDQKGTDVFEHKRGVIQSKIDLFTKKMQAIQNENSKPASDALEEWEKQTIAFSESCMVLVHFGINNYLADAGFHSPDISSNSISAHNITVPGAFHASVITDHARHQKNDYSIHDYDFTFPKPSSTGWVLFGDYLPKKEDNNYPAAFTKSFRNRATVLDNVKAVACDQVQTIQVHVQGGSRGVYKIMNVLDWKKIDTLLYNN